MSTVKEDFFDVIGSFGSWQKIIFAIIFYMNLVCIWQNFSMTFLAPNVPFRCVEPPPRNDTGFSGQCSIPLYQVMNVSKSNLTEIVPCTRWEYDTSEYSDTLVSEWDLVCDREWLISFAKSIYMIGFVVSVFVFGQIADWIGRFPTIAICYVTTVLSLGLSLVSTSITFFLVFRFIQALCRTGLINAGFVLIMECVGSKHRTSVGLCIQLGWSLGFASLGLIAYYFRHWFWFQLAISIPVLPLAFAYKFIPESPRWLMMHKKTDRLKKVIAEAAKRNGKELQEDEDDLIKRLVTVKTENKGTLLDLFRTPRMRVNTFNMMYLWFVNTFVYYALSFNTNDLSGNPYLNFIISGLLEFPSFGFLYLSIWCFGRRNTLIGLMMALGVICIALVLVPTDFLWVSVCLAQLGKFFVNASFGLMYLYTGELFPTVVRNAAIGSCSAISGVGSILSPFTRELGKASHPSVTNIIYCILAVSSGLLAIWLPETSGRKLPDTLQEGEEFEMQ